MPKHAFICTCLRSLRLSMVQFLLKTRIFWRAMAKWLLPWVGTRKMLPRSGYKFLVALNLGRFVTVWNLSRIKNTVFHQKLMFFEELWQNGGYSENIQEICYLEQGINFLCDLFLPCLWPADILNFKFVCLILYKTF